jgi:hypothetical protein
MAGPDLAFLESLNTLLPYVGMVVVGIVAACVFVWYTKKYTPEIARTFIKAYHSRGLPVFIQDEMGNIELQICDKKFPEGVVHTKRGGWFLLPSPLSDALNGDDEVAEVKRGPGRPPKKELPPKALEELKKLGDPKELAKMYAENRMTVAMREEYEKYAEAYGILLQVPILKGFGKQVFFGSATCSALSSLRGIAHANILEVRKLAPMMYQKTQLDALATGSRIEGLKMSGKETTKLLMYAIIAAVPIAVVGLVVYLLTQGNTPAVV